MSGLGDLGGSAVSFANEHECHSTVSGLRDSCNFGAGLLGVRPARCGTHKGVSRPPAPQAYCSPGTPGRRALRARGQRRRRLLSPGAPPGAPLLVPLSRHASRCAAALPAPLGCVRQSENSSEG